MKYKIEELKDITDSREIMQSSPKGFSKYMTYIILALLVCFLVWTLLATKEITVTARGMVTPYNDVTKVTSPIQGIVAKVNLQESITIKKGDIILEINATEYGIQRDMLQGSKNGKEKELHKLVKLKKSILEKKNLFNKELSEENEYYEKYRLYEQSLNYSNSGQAIQNIEKTEIDKSLEQLDLLDKSIKEEKNYLKENSSVYYEYKSFVIGMNSYRDIIKDYEEKINKLEKGKSDTSKEFPQEIEKINISISEIKKSIESTKLEMTKLKNTSLMNVQNAISQYKSRSLQLNTVNSSSYTEQYLSNIDTNINGMESSISEIDMNLKMAEEKVKLTIIKAPCDGVMNIISNIKEGDYVQNGTPIISIVPEENQSFNVEIYIPNENFGEIKENQEVSIELLSLPGREYGYIKSNLKNISVDAKISEEKGVSYYCAVCSINTSSLKNSKGNEVRIKNGMMAQAKIINRRVSYFRYFLEKIDILD